MFIASITNKLDKFDPDRRQYSQVKDKGKILVIGQLKSERGKKLVKRQKELEEEKADQDRLDQLSKALVEPMDLRVEIIATILVPLVATIEVVSKSKAPVEAKKERIKKRTPT